MPAGEPGASFRIHHYEATNGHHVFAGGGDTRGHWRCADTRRFTHSGKERRFLIGEFDFAVQDRHAIAGGLPDRRHLREDRCARRAELVCLHVREYLDGARHRTSAPGWNGFAARRFHSNENQRDGVVDRDELLRGDSVQRPVRQPGIRRYKQCNSNACQWERHGIRTRRETSPSRPLYHSVARAHASRFPAGPGSRRIPFRCTPGPPRSAYGTPAEASTEGDGSVRPICWPARAS